MRILAGDIGGTNTRLLIWTIPFASVRFTRIACAASRFFPLIRAFVNWVTVAVGTGDR